MLFKLFQVIEDDVELVNTFYEVGIMLIVKLDNNNRKKKVIVHFHLRI